MNSRELIILVCILLIAAFLRFYRLDSLPPSLEWDEVATGYDANSILRTGRDQFGNFLPLTFRSLDDYKPPLYTYLTSLSIAVLGWNDFAVRFPAAFLGVAAVFTTYGMTYALFKKKNIALIAALLLSVSPWHVGFSRLALETNSTIFFTTAGVWTFLIGLKRGRYLILSAFFLGLNLYLYHNSRIFIPLLGFLLIILFRNQLWVQKKFLLVSAIITLIFVVRLIPIATSIEGQMRFLGTSLFTEAEPLDISELKETYVDWRNRDIQQGLGFMGRIYHSDKVLFGLKIFKNYISHFDPTFWIFTSDNPRHHVSEMGLLYFIDLPLILIGLYYLFKERNYKIVIIILGWMIFTPIPASVTRDAPHALRTAIFLPMFQILAALAIVGLYKSLTSKNYRYLLLGVTSILYVINVSFFLHQYFVHYAKDTSKYWQYGRREAAEFTESVIDRYDRIVVSTKLEQPHVFWLYYLKYDPAEYLREGGTVSGGWAEERNNFDKYQFKRINYPDMRDGRTLFVGKPDEFYSSTQPLKKIQYLNGEEAIWIVEG